MFIGLVIEDSNVSNVRIEDLFKDKGLNSPVCASTASLAVIDNLKFVVEIKCPFSFLKM